MLVCVNTYLSNVFPEGGNKWSLSNGAKDGGEARHITISKVTLPANRGLVPLRCWPAGDVAIP